MGAEKARSRLPWPPAVGAILWLDAVLVVAAALALAGMRPSLAFAAAWSWIALAGAAATAILAALSAFQLSVRSAPRVWTWLPVPALLVWLGASAFGCFAGGAGAADAWGDTTAEAGQCLKFLLGVSAPLLALILYMLRRAAPGMRLRAMLLGGLASAGAAAGLLELVHPHSAALLDLGAHAVAVAAVLAASVFVVRSS